MKKMLILLILMCVIIPLDKAWGAFNLSVTPYEGGYDLRYGKVTFPGPRVNKELTVNITTDLGRQYRLIQNLIAPFTSASGLSIPQNNFLVYGIRGTNKYGTLNVEEERPVGFSRTYIYTSDQSGLADSFTLVYGLQGPFDVPPGIYRGRLSFSLEAIDAAQAPVTVILDVSAEIDIASKIEITTASGSKIISLDPRKEDKGTADVLVSIQGGMGSQYKIVQAMNENPISSEGIKLSEEAVKLVIKEVKKGTGLVMPTDLSLRPQTIYTSSLNGEPESFVVTYSLGNLEKEKAGSYRTTLKYLLEGGAYIKEGLIGTLTLEVENERTFELVVTPEMGGALRFQNLKAGAPSQTNEVIIKINTNIGRPYQVSQKIMSQFTSPEGNVIPVEYFTLREETLDSKGVLKYPRKTEVGVGDLVLFVSDEQGSPTNFKLIYELGIPPDLKAGDYSTTLIYSLAEI